MIKLSLINGKFSSTDGKLNVEKLIESRFGKVILSCDEPHARMGGDLENKSAEYLTKLMPLGFKASWDEGKEGYCLQKQRLKTLPAMIKELRFCVIIDKVE